MEEEIITPEEEVFDYHKLRYILNDEGYLIHTSLGGLIVCDLGECTEYNGEVPSGYNTIEEWHDKEIDKLNAWKIVEGNLVFDASKCADIQERCKQEEIDNSCVTHKEMYGLVQEIEDIQELNTSQYTEQVASGKIVAVDNVKKVYPRIKITDIKCGNSFSMTWDGTIEDDLQSYQRNFGEDMGDAFFCQVTTEILDPQQFIGATAEVYTNSDGFESTFSMTIQRYITQDYGYTLMGTSEFGEIPAIEIITTPSLATNEYTGTFFFGVPEFMYIREITKDEGYDKVNLITTGKNMLPNEAYSQTIEGITFEQNEDKSITINGTSTNAIEYNIAGTSTNTSPFLCLKKDTEYYLSSNDMNIKMYNYDGTNRTEVYSGTGGIIKFTDDDKPVTQITLTIASGKKVDVTVYPQLELGTTGTDYEEFQSSSLEIDLKEYIEPPLLPSDTLYPSDDLLPAGTTIGYILIENGTAYIKVNDKEVEIETDKIKLYSGFATVYTIQDTQIEMTYCINNLKLEGTTTKNNNFKVKEDGSIEAHNGYFSGVINATDGYFKGEVRATSGSFKGSITSSNANITGGLINLTGASYYVPRIQTSGTGFVGFTNTSKVYPDGIRIFSEDGNELGQFSVIKHYYQGEYSQGCGLSVNKENSDATASMNADEISITENGSGTYISSSSVETPILYQTSLEEHKKNIEKFDDALPIVNTIDLYKYNLTSEEDGHKKHIGFVIGENYNYSSEITAVNKEGEEIGVDNYSMASLCLQAIKELNLKIETLEKKIKELESDK